MNSNHKKLIRQTVGLAVILGYPLLVLILAGWFLIPSRIGYQKESTAFFLLTLICIALVVLTPKASPKRWFAGLAAIYLTLLCFIKLSFYYNFGVKLSASALFVIFETNATEASDFLSSYMNGAAIGGLLLMATLFLISAIQLKRFPFETYTSTAFIKIFSVVGIICSVAVIDRRFSHENILIKSIDSYAAYTQAQINLKAELAQSTSPNIDVTGAATEDQTYVVVIGESTSRWHMQLYGYDRETNPLLLQMKDELLIFNDVITPNVNTTGALDKILTKSDHDRPNTKNNASIVQLANEAGFSTYWISNQQPVGIHDAYASLIGNAAGEQFFIAADDYEYDIYDETLLPVLDSVLTKPPRKKMIFLHLIGTHGSYKRRYPRSFDHFNEIPLTEPGKGEHALNLINEYDSSIRYNDFVVSEIIKRVKAERAISYVLYFSDHGDDVFDVTQDFVGGHNEFKPTKPMYDVPFLVWLSSEYRLNYPDALMVDNTNQPYILEDFMHSFAELSQIEFASLDYAKSIFSSRFRQKTRRVINGANYDEK